MKAFARLAKRLPRITTSHEMDFVANCKAGTAAGADFAYSGPLTEMCLLGNVAKLRRTPGSPPYAWGIPST